MPVLVPFGHRHGLTRKANIVTCINGGFRTRSVVFRFQTLPSGEAPICSLTHTYIGLSVRCIALCRLTSATPGRGIPDRRRTQSHCRIYKCQCVDSDSGPGAGNALSGLAVWAGQRPRLHEGAHR